MKRYETVIVKQGFVSTEIDYINQKRTETVREPMSEIIIRLNNEGYFISNYDFDLSRYVFTREVE